MIASFKKKTLYFKSPSGTSRGILTEKDSWYLLLEENGKKGIGECSIVRGLSPDDRPDYEDRLKLLCDALSSNGKLPDLTEFPSIRMGHETAVRSLKGENTFELFLSDFSSGKALIPTNGLVWMGNPDFMKGQIEDLLNQGFKCIKMKLGAIDFQSELNLVAGIRKRYDEKTIAIRVDANGAFSPADALVCLEALSKYKIHSIEQPIAPRQWEAMNELCKTTPIPIALDEELIGIHSTSDQETLLDFIQPQYIIIKPSLLGGFDASDSWIKLAEQRNVDWWATSALESNIGLNAIAQWIYTKKPHVLQGLGTGSLFTNNIESPLKIKSGNLLIDRGLSWNFIF